PASCVTLFSLPIPRPPRSTLFPYTTLFRSTDPGASSCTSSPAPSSLCPRTITDVASSSRHTHNAILPARGGRRRLIVRQHQRSQAASIYTSRVEPRRVGLELKTSLGVVPEDDVGQLRVGLRPAHFGVAVARRPSPGQGADMKQGPSLLLLEGNPRGNPRMDHSYIVRGKFQTERHSLELGPLLVVQLAKQSLV